MKTTKHTPKQNKTELDLIELDDTKSQRIKTKLW